MDPRHEHFLQITRRYFFGRSAAGIGTAALASILNPAPLSASESPRQTFGALPALHRTPKAKRVSWIFMADAASQLDLFDHKPGLTEHFDKALTESICTAQRNTTISSGQ